MVGMVVRRLGEADARERGWLLDGFPRNEAQADALAAEGIQPEVFLLISVSCWGSFLRVMRLHRRLWRLRPGWGSGCKGEAGAAGKELSCKDDWSAEGPRAVPPQTDSDTPSTLFLGPPSLPGCRHQPSTDNR